MSYDSLAMIFWLLLFAEGLLFFELRASAVPPSCRHCAHCQRLREEQEARRRVEQERLDAFYGARNRHDDDPRD